jgi:hypothetical protein
MWRCGDDLPSPLRQITTSPLFASGVRTARAEIRFRAIGQSAASTIDIRPKTTARDALMGAALQIDPAGARAEARRGGLRVRSRIT